MKQITFSQTALGKLMNDIRKVELLSLQEEIELTTKIKQYQEFLDKVKLAKEELPITLGRLVTATDIATKLGMTLKEYNRIFSVGNFNRNKLIEANIRLVISIAKKYNSSINNKFVNIQLNDLVQEGVFGLIRAAEKFDPEKGFKFSTYSCVPTSTKILTKRGWLNWDEIKQNDFTIGYNLNTKQTEWTKIEKVTDYPKAPLLKIGNTKWSTLCTANHKWLMEYSTEVKLKPIEEWPTEKDIFENSKDIKLILAAPFIGGNSTLTSHEASLVAWLLSQGFDYVNSCLDDELPISKLWEKAGLHNQSLLDLVFDLPPIVRKAFTDTLCKYKNYIISPITKEALEILLFLEGNNNPLDIEEALTPANCSVVSTDIVEHVWCPSTELGTWTAKDENENIFLTGNTWWVKQAISKYISENNKPIRIPIHISDLINKIKYTTKELEIRNGRPPSEREIATELNITVKRIRKAIEVSKPVISLDFTYIDQQDSAISSSLVERIKSPDIAPDSSIEREDLLRIIDTLLEELDEVDKNILIYRFGLKGTKATIAELATKYSISKEIVRKKEQAAIKYLKKRNIELVDFS